MNERQELFELKLWALIHEAWDFDVKEKMVKGVTLSVHKLVRETYPDQIMPCDLCGKKVNLTNNEPLYPHGSGHACEECKITHNFCPKIYGLEEAKEE